MTKPVPLKKMAKLLKVCDRCVLLDFVFYAVFVHVLVYMFLLENKNKNRDVSAAASDRKRTVIRQSKIRVSLPVEKAAMMMTKMALKMVPLQKKWRSSCRYACVARCFVRVFTCFFCCFVST